VHALSDMRHKSEDMIALPEPLHLPEDIDAVKRAETLQDLISNVINGLVGRISSSPVVQFGMHLLAPARLPVRSNLVAWHSFRNVVAVAGPTYVYFFWEFGWVNADQPLTNKRFKDGIFALTWSPSSDLLYVGTSTGICCFRTNFEVSKHDCHFNLDFVLETETQAASHSLAFAPDGRLLVSSANNDRAIYVWDTVMKKTSKMWCFDGGLGNALVQWSPSGLHLAVGASDGLHPDEPERGMVVFVETNEWTRAPVSHEQPLQALVWVGTSDLLYCTQGGQHVHHSALDPNNPVAQPLSNAPAPFSLAHDMTRITGDGGVGNLAIHTLVSDPLTGRVAVSFAYTDPSDTGHDGTKGKRLYHKVAVYLSLCHPIFSLTLDEKSCITGTPDREPISMAFRPSREGSTSRNSDLCVLWKDEKGRHWMSLH